MDDMSPKFQNTVKVKENSVNGKICSRESSANGTCPDVNKKDDTVVEMQSTLKVEEDKEEPEELNLQNADKESTSTLAELKELNSQNADEEPASSQLNKVELEELNSQNADKEPSSIQVELEELNSQNVDKEPSSIQVELEELNSPNADKEPSSIQGPLVADLCSVSVNRQIELPQDNRGSNMGVQYNKVSRADGVGCDEKQKYNIPPSTCTRSIEEKTYESSVSSKSFEREIDLRQHLSTFTRKDDFLCDICLIFFKNKESLSVHMQKHSKDKDSNIDFETGVMSSEKNKTREGEMAFPLKPTETKPGATTGKCPVCLKFFPRKYDFRRHLLTHSGINYQCVICLTCCENREDLSDHLRKHFIDDVKIMTGSKRESKESAPVPKPQTNSIVITFECPVCSKHFRRKYDFRRHLITHSGVNNQCVLCPTLFKNKENLSEHIRTHSIDNLVRKQSVHSSNISLSDNVESNLQEIILQTKDIKTNTEIVINEESHVEDLRNHQGNDTLYEDVETFTIIRSGEHKNQEAYTISLPEAITTNVDILTCSTEEHISEQVQKYSNQQAQENREILFEKNVQKDNLLYSTSSKAVISVKNENAEQNISRELIGMPKHMQKGNISEHNKKVSNQLSHHHESSKAVKYDKHENEAKAMPSVNTTIRRGVEKHEMKETSASQTLELRAIRFFLHSNAQSNKVEKIDEYENEKNMKTMTIPNNIKVKESHEKSVSDFNQKVLKYNPLSNSNVLMNAVARCDKRKHEDIEHMTLSKIIEPNYEEKIKFKEHLQKYSEYDQSNHTALQSDKLTDIEKMKKKRRKLIEKLFRHNTWVKIRRCPYCEKAFVSTSELREHKLIHPKDNLECNVCKATFKYRASLKMHLRIHSNKPFQCKICEKKFSEDRQLAIHMRIHFGSRPYQCDICKISFTQYAYLHMHKRVHGEKPYKCDVCQHSFAIKGNLILHIRTHTKEKSYHCSVCWKNFTSQNDLCKHSCIHVSENLFQCNDGKKGFTQKDLERDSQLHLKVKPFKCQVCDLKFTLYVNLRKHLKIHSKEKRFICEMCGKCFSQSGDLYRHKKTHPEERPYSCFNCNKNFSQKMHLVHHMITHSGEKPFMCKVCGKGFSQSGMLQKHKHVHFVVKS